MESIMDIMGNVEYYGYHGQCGVLLWISWAVWSIILDIVGKYGI